MFLCQILHEVGTLYSKSFPEYQSAPYLTWHLSLCAYQLSQMVLLLYFVCQFINKKFYIFISDTDFQAGSFGHPPLPNLKFFTHFAYIIINFLSFLHFLSLLWVFIPFHFLIQLLIKRSVAYQQNRFSLFLLFCFFFLKSFFLRLNVILQKHLEWIEVSMMCSHSYLLL